MMVKRAVTVSDATPPERRRFFDEMNQLVLEAGDPSVRQLAAMTGLSHGYVHKALRGPAYPSVRSVELILAALGRAEQRDRMIELLQRSRSTETTNASLAASPTPTTSPAIASPSSAPALDAPRDHSSSRSLTVMNATQASTHDTQPVEVPGLSDREREVLRAWVLADSKEEVGRSLFISESTVNTHIARIRLKYEHVGRPAPTKAALLARALQDGIISMEQL